MRRQFLRVYFDLAIVFALATWLWLTGRWAFAIAATNVGTYYLVRVLLLAMRARALRREAEAIFPGVWHLLTRERDDSELPGRALARPGALLDLFGFLFGRTAREDIETAITDLGLDAEDMRTRGFSERWIFFIIKARELRELAAFLWQWVRGIRLPRAGHGRNSDEPKP